MTYEVVRKIGGFKRAAIRVRESVSDTECGILPGGLISFRLAQFNPEILMSKKKSREIFGLK